MRQAANPGMPGAGRGITAVLGPTNTGKTHLAIERMLGHDTGLIGLPLRLLAREVYGRIAERIGKKNVALVTGEEKIIPAATRYWVSTTEAMPEDIAVDFVAIDEVQLATNIDRGHVFTDRILRSRGAQETLLLGSLTMRPLLERLLPGINIITRPRMSVLSYAGDKKVSRLPRRSAIVAFSAADVYGIAELVRRQRGGAAVVMGSLSPRTRNAQVALYQNGDVDYLVATDAIGMGLNLDLHHVAFAGRRKFDGFQYRELTPAEIGQIAGRAGRHLRDGTFGVTGRTEPFEDEIVQSIESHTFPVDRIIQWRNDRLDFSSLKALQTSLDEAPDSPYLARAPGSSDVQALDLLSRQPEILDRVTDRASVETLWNVCLIPDYRKISPANHADLIGDLFRSLIEKGTVDEDWFARQVDLCDRPDGDIDTISNRIAHIRTWTYVANRKGWLDRSEKWQEETRRIEDRLSDALHERLLQRFVDRRTSVLMKRLRENTMLECQITSDGDVEAEGQHLGRIDGFRFTADPNADGPEAKALRAAAQKSLAAEIEKRAEKVSMAAAEAFALSADGILRWSGQAVGRLAEGAKVLTPRIIVLADEQLTGASLEKVQNRLNLWISQHVEKHLEPLIALNSAEGVEGLARGLAFRLVENQGVVARAEVADDVRQIEQTERAALRQLGVRFGAHHIFVPAILKPAPAGLNAILWALKNGEEENPGVLDLPARSAAGRTSFPLDERIPASLYRVCGFKICGNRAVRVDILERLADQIRPMLAWRSSSGQPRPDGAVDGRSFMVTIAMTSLLGCSGEDFAAVLKALGYRSETVKKEDLPEELFAKPETETVPETGKAETEEKAETQSAEPSAEAAEESPADAPSEQAEAEPAAAEPEAEAPTEPAETAPQDSDAPAAEETGGEPAQAEADTAAPASDPSESTEDTSAEPDEPATVEIWRPQRQNTGRNFQNRNRNRGQKQAGTDAAAENSAGDGSGGFSRSQQERRQNQAERFKGGYKGGGSKGGEQGDRSGGKGKAKGRPNKGRSGPVKMSSGPSKNSKALDPDNPFAKLAALKADMEKK